MTLDIRDSTPIVRFAIMRRIPDALPHCRIADVKMVAKPATLAKPEHLQVGVWLVDTRRMTDNGILDVRGFFDLPRFFDHTHLLNEIDEIVESVKKARIEASISVLRGHRPEKLRVALPGTGLDGRWPA